MTFRFITHGRVVTQGRPTPSFSPAQQIWARILSGLSLIGLLLLGNVAQAQSESQAQTQQAPRLVIAGGGLTEIVYALGAQAHIVGVDTTSRYPQEATQLPSIGYLRALSSEGVMSLTPDIVLTTDDAGPASVIAVLKQAKVNIRPLNSEDSVSGLIARIQSIGEIVHKPKEAKQLIADIQSQHSALKKRVSQLKKPPRILFLLTHAGLSPRSAGKGTAGDAMINMIGGVNVANQFSGYKILGEEAIVALNPEYILTTTQGLKHIGGKKMLLKRAGVGLTQAGKQGRVIDMDGVYLLNFGPRVVQAGHDLLDKIELSKVNTQ